MTPPVDVSVILPVHNAARWLDACLQSVLDQETADLVVEVSVFLDGCMDQSEMVLQRWQPRLEDAGFSVVVSSGSPSRGVGFAKNRAVHQSSGNFLCFLDADDVMTPCRIRCQHSAALNNRQTIVGGRFRRDPDSSTQRYTRWANELPDTQLELQVLTANGPTVIMPTWFCHRQVFDRVEGFDEGGRGTPEDLIFFFRHLRLGGRVQRVPEVVLVYRYHPEAATFSIHEDTIWSLRLDQLCEVYLERWSHFTIWNAGKQGKKLYRQLAEKYRVKVRAFCDVAERKIRHGLYTYYESSRRPKPMVPVVHFSKAEKPFVICVKMDLTDGEFESNLNSLGLEEGKDYVMFS